MNGANWVSDQRQTLPLSPTNAAGNVPAVVRFVRKGNLTRKRLIRLIIIIILVDICTCHFRVIEDTDQALENRFKLSAWEIHQWIMMLFSGFHEIWPEAVVTPLVQIPATGVDQLRLEKWSGRHACWNVRLTEKCFPKLYCDENMT